MEERLKWDEIVKKYPDQWVAVKDYDAWGPDIFSGVVCAHCKDEDCTQEEKKLLEQGIAFRWARTADLGGACVL